MLRQASLCQRALPVRFDRTRRGGEGGDEMTGGWLGGEEGEGGDGEGLAPAVNREPGHRRELRRAPSARKSAEHEKRGLLEAFLEKEKT